MNLRLSRISVAAVGSLLILATMDGAPPARGAKRKAKPTDHYAQTMERIDALIKHRLSPDPLPAVLPNPFQMPGTAAGTDLLALDPSGPHGTDPVKPDHPTPPVDLAPATDSEALARYAAALKITGAVRLNGQLHLIINQSPYKEGDLVLLNNTEPPTYLQVIRIAPGELTLGLNDAVLTLKVKN